MIRSVKLDKEIVLSAKNKVGLMAEVAKLLADHGINVEGVAGYEQGGEARLMFVVDDTLRASDALKKKGYNIKENEVIMVDLENKSGALKVVTAKLAADKIDIKYMYGTVCGGSCPARIVIATNSNEKAEVLLSK